MKIRIVKTPPGEAPEEIRKEWVGLVMPIADDTENGFQAGVCGGTPQNLGGYSVNASDAVLLLNEKSEEAAKWWADRLPFYTTHLVFSKDVCEVV